MEELGMDFDFFDAGKTDFFAIFLSERETVLNIGKILCSEGLISPRYLAVLPHIISNSMWYENRMRVYLLLNLYAFSRFSI